ncbi:MAG: sensor domain-containing diguanylate cyclase [Thermodesulfobacteriota bacterium]
MEIHVAQNDMLDNLLASTMTEEAISVGSEVDLQNTLKVILEAANEFVPSESGSILLCDMMMHHLMVDSKKLYFVACFGRYSESLLHITMPSSMGIAGKTFTNGEPYISEEVATDGNWYTAIDKKTEFETKSIICAPIKLEGTVIGIIELINKFDDVNYEPKDLTLLQIFADYTSTLIQNSLYAKTFKRLSIHDGLTGLFNGRHFNKLLVDEIVLAKEKGSDLSVVFIDLDNFKIVNDTLGHMAGSRVLKEIGTILKGIRTNKNVALARYGGDEFVIIVPDSSIEETKNYAEEVRNTISEHVFLRKSDREGATQPCLNGVITTSIGVAALDQKRFEEFSVDEITTKIIKAADKAMYASKENGKDRITLAE